MDKCVDNFINNINKKSKIKTKFTYFINENIWRPSSGVGDQTSKAELLQDYLDNGQYDEIISELLNKRLNWEFESDPIENGKVTFSYVGTDMAIRSSPSMFKREFWNNISKEEKDDLVHEYVNRLAEVKKIKKYKGASYNRDVQSVSRISNRIPKLTRLLGNKFTFYNIIEEYTTHPDTIQNIIPKYTEFKTSDPSYLETVKQFISSNKTQIYILRPSGGIGGVGLVIANEGDMLNIIPTHVGVVFKGKRSKYIDWVISEFKQSFLWKLKSDIPDSSKLLKLWDKDKISNLSNNKFKRVIYPKQLSNLHYTDKIGRINKGRVWFAYEVKNKQLVLSVYKKVQFELAPEEYKNYKNPYQVITDLGKQYFHIKKKLDLVNAGRAADLNLSFIVDWKTGKWGKNKQFPVNWKIVKKNLILALDSIVESIKYSSVCMSYPNNNIDPLGCFQVFSVDFIVDSFANTWMLECNTRPWVGFGKWWKKFDPNFSHINDKWVFFDTLLSKTVDTYCKPKKASSLNYKKYWEVVVKKSKKSYKTPDFYFTGISPTEKQLGNYFKKEVLKLLSSRGWSSFPWKKYMDTPDFVFQGITPLLKYILEKDTYNRNKIIKAYPELLKAGVINRIFPLVVYFGNKAVLVKILKDKFPNNWYNIIPWSFAIDKSKENWEQKTISEYKQGHALYNNDNMTWIAKPSHGLQGLGIIISTNVGEIIEHIKKSEDTHWVTSVYIGNPLTLKKKKNHIRVFVLINKNKKGIKAYLFNKHFVFSAPLEYNTCKLMNNEDKEFCNLTNLAVGARYYKNMGKLPEEAYGDLSGSANIDFNEDKFNKKKIYEPVKKLDSYKKFKKSFDDNNKVRKKKGQSHLEDNFYNVIVNPQIQQMTKDCIDAVSPYITCIQEKEKNFEGCFQYIAFDLMLDDGIKGDIQTIPKLWLLEINTSPGLKAPRAQDKTVYLQFLNNMFDIVLSKREKKFNKKTKSVFDVIYTLDKKVTPKIKNLVTEQLMFERIKDKYMPGHEKLFVPKI
jgi:hypothetical protein